MFNSFVNTNSEIDILGVVPGSNKLNSKCVVRPTTGVVGPGTICKGCGNGVDTSHEAVFVLCLNQENLKHVQNTQNRRNHRKTY